MTRVRALAGVFVVGVLCASGELVAGADTGWELPKLPAYSISDAAKNRDWYPLPARWNGLEGRVLVGFDIGSDGRTKNISVIWAEDQVFAANTVQLLSVVRYHVPPDWASSGARRRWRLGFVYCLVPSGQSDEFAIPVEKVTVSGSRLSGRPVLTKPAVGASGSCAQAK